MVLVVLESRRIITKAFDIIVGKITLEEMELNGVRNYIVSK